MRRTSLHMMHGRHPIPGPSVVTAPLRAFTLIELLIVVAIIAILAAIAVPNFLQAQVRSKVARTETDLRTLATALEAYRIDNNSYYPARFYQNLAERIVPLTTPVAYITSVPVDLFFQYSTANFAGAGQNWYAYVSGNIYLGRDDFLPEYAKTLYTVAGRGPDGNYNFGGICTIHPLAIPTNALERGSYDPTNGTISEGDIIRPGPGRL